MNAQVAAQAAAVSVRYDLPVGGYWITGNASFIADFKAVFSADNNNWRYRDDSIQRILDASV